ncbi:hypothetical protein JWJ90_19245 [Desulfobulbus rhabdoformis]|uniref:hypothetical protein n=1 Tax=Desulfobulbus rhabdoformis TaxID=34032 RepID=UPI001966A373|nr:hypothetical protein [Desulfobulbus rhabdoformis]MBM9616408.1 hypothetical protein [Desulfobulbus rhabdoformis]
MASIFVAIKNDSEALTLPNDGVTIFLHFDFLSSVGEDENCGRLDDFLYTSTDQLADFLRKAGATDKQIEKANPVVWYPASVGTALVTKYISVLGRYHTIGEETRTEALKELKMFRAIFEVLEQENNEWHLEMDI